MKRIFALLLAMALLAGMAAGCGSAPSEPAQSAESVNEISAAPEAPVEEALPEASEEPEESEEASQAEFVSAMEEAAEPEIPYFPLEEAAHLSMWFAYQPIFSEYADGPEEYLIFTEAASRLNVDLEVIGISMAGANEQFNLMIASGEYPDIIERFGAYYQNSLDSAMDDEIAIELLTTGPRTSRQSAPGTNRRSGSPPQPMAGWPVSTPLKPTVPRIPDPLSARTISTGWI